MVSPGHLLQFHRTNSFLTEAVAGYLAEGLARGEGGMVVATPAHVAAIREKFPATAPIVWLDAADVLDRLEAGRFTREVFDAAILPAIEMARAASGNRRIRAFGEMVDLLWQRAAYGSVETLEALWDTFIRREPVTLLCGYRIDPLGPTVQADALSRVIDAHATFLPDADSLARRHGLERAVEEVLGPGRFAMLRNVAVSERMRDRDDAPVEPMIAWLRTRMPRLASDVLPLARRYAAGA